MSEHLTYIREMYDPFLGRLTTAFKIEVHVVNGEIKSATVRDENDLAVDPPFARAFITEALLSDGREELISV